MANTWPLFFMCDQVASFISKLHVLFYGRQSWGPMKVSTLPGWELGLEPGHLAPESTFESLSCFQEASSICPPCYTCCEFTQGSVGREGHRSQRGQWLACLGPGLLHHAPPYLETDQAFAPHPPRPSTWKALGSVGVRFEPKARMGSGKSGLGSPRASQASHSWCLGAGAAHSPRGRIPKCLGRG